MRQSSWQSLLLLLFITLSGTGCGSGGGDIAAPIVAAPTPTATTGEVIIGLTDAPGDLQTYKVDVLSVKLTRADGTEIETLPFATTVDFAQYVELTEFLTAATVPSGIYTGASLLLDYSAAEIAVENDAGDAVEAIAVDTNRNPLGQLEVGIQLAGSDTFRIAPGIPAHITLDFDLEASHKTDLLTTPAEVLVDPVLLVDTALEAPKTHRVRGLLRSVSVAEGNFVVAIRPFFAPAGDYGPLTVHTTPTTDYDVDGVAYTGVQGLEALDTLGAGSAVIAVGEFDRVARHFVATDVVAGSSLPWGDADLARGTVISRDGDILTLRGATLIRANSSVVFNADVAITIGPDTTYSKQGGPNAGLSSASVSVGQRIAVSGTLTDSSFDNLALDATGGRLRMSFTDLTATVVQPSPLVIDLQRINGRRVGLYDFAGTGNIEDADPENYEVDTNSLSLAGIMTLDPVRVRGHVAEFGAAPSDFFAKSLVDVGNRRGHLRLGWQEAGDPGAVTALDASGIVLALNADTLSRVHHFIQAGVGTDLLDLGTTLTLSAPTSGRGAFTLIQSGTRQVFNNFAEFVEELSLRLDGTTTLMSVNARGALNADALAVVAHRIVIRLQ